MRVFALVSWVFMTAPVVALLLQTREAAWTAMIGYHLGCVAATSLVGFHGGVKPSVRMLAVVAISSSLLVLAAFFLVLESFPSLREMVSTWSRWGLEPPGDVWILVYYVGINPWVEEFFWRAGLLHPAVRQQIGDRRARALSVFGFVPFHAVVLFKGVGVDGLVLALPILLASMIWVDLFERTRGVWASAFSHQAANLSLGLAYLLWLRPVAE